MKFIPKEELSHLNTGDKLQYRCDTTLYPVKAGRNKAVTVEKLTKNTEGVLIRIMLSVGSCCNIIADVGDYEKHWALFR